MSGPRTILVGIGGYGRVHLAHLLDFHRRGELGLVAAVAFPPEPDTAVLAELRAAGCEVLDSFEALLAALPRLHPTLAVVPTPIHLHARMTVALLEAGIDVLVEKPLAATLGEVEAIRAAQQRTGRRVAVGFQYLHAPEVLALKHRLRAGAIGSLRRLVVHTAWPRSHAYYARNAWAGRLRLGEDWVLDSPVSNAMSHFLMVMLFLAGQEETGLARPAWFAAELYRAQAIESFDTAVIHFKTTDGLRLDFYGTHSARENARPSLRIEGDAGTAEWEQDSHAHTQGPDGGWEQEAAPEPDTRERMLRDVLAWLRGEPAFVCSTEMAAEHVRCVAELHRQAVITAIPPAHLAQYRSAGQEFTWVPALDDQLRRAAQAGLGLAATGAPWAVSPPGWVAFGPAV